MKYYHGIAVTEIEAEEAPQVTDYMKLKSGLKPGKERADIIEDKEIQKIDRSVK